MYSFRRALILSAVVFVVCVGAYLGVANASPVAGPGSPIELGTAPVATIAPETAMLAFVALGGLIMLVRPRRRSM